MKLLFACLIFPFLLSAKISSPKYFEQKTHYKTDFGQCPSKVVGKLALDLVKVFDNSKSLFSVKKAIIDEKLEEKYFLSSYQIGYDPLLKTLNLNFNCPKPLMKVQIYKEGGEEYYTAILVDSGELYDPTYEVLLRAENKIKGTLPHMAFPASLLDSGEEKKLTSLFNVIGEEFTRNISEVILNEDKELTIILSLGRKPSSAFLGHDQWSEKVDKLDSVIKFMQKKKTIPAVINLTNLKKVVVKFSDTI
ncbi:MAG: hypothetical protein CME65_09700 [Halobacteriovoraceae bacterium]|nr:hypothetical protein [Halobacteriovoraceae bacterium]|tara:strand:+ start:13763 stop:14509 length:747 start_codon:yes stop_codon:yes gene_type:complete